VLAGGIARAISRGGHDGRLDSVEQRGERVVVAFSWADKHGSRHARAQAMTFRNGRIVDIQDYSSPARAVLSLRLRVVLS
jgi:hypothetical protein